MQVDWQLYGPKLAQVALTFGADDVDGVSAVDDMRLGRRRAPLEEIRRNIVAASGEPVERDGLLRAARLMASIRIGAVSYLNARPLVDGLGSLARSLRRPLRPAEHVRAAAARTATSISG